MRIHELKVSPVGADGVAAGTARKGVGLFGVLRGVEVKYTGQPATVDVTIDCVYAGVTKTLLTLTSTNTDFPLAAIFEAGKDNVGASVAAGKNAELVLPLVAGELLVTVAQGDAATDGVKVRLLVGDA